MAGRCAAGCRCLPLPRRQLPCQQSEQSVCHVQPRFLGLPGFSIFSMAIGCCLAHLQPVAGTDRLVNHRNLWPEDTSLNNVSLVRRHTAMAQELLVDRASMAKQRQQSFASIEDPTTPLADATMQHVFFAAIAPTGLVKVDKQSMLSGAANSTTNLAPGLITAPTTEKDVDTTPITTQAQAAAATAAAAAPAPASFACWRFSGVWTSAREPKKGKRNILLKGNDSNELA
mmetsp:Transcript_85424/g.164466  ORF Transcript_85424/g.164466 Transcript_85424/m.164466 type:complete len:229 (+) Transcript_85424:36-722(+)